jgi:hypothetical protein
MASFDDSPGENWFPAGQHLIYTISTQETITDAFRFIVQVEENGTEIAKIYLAPNTNDKGIFDLSQVVTGRVEVDSLKYGATTDIHVIHTKVFTRANNGVKRYEVKIGEWNGSSESLDEDNQTLYLVDGYEQISEGLHPGFANFYGTQSNRKVWLTDRVPVDDVIEIKAAIEDNGVAAFLNTDDTGSNIDRLQIKIYNTGGVLNTTLTYDINFTNGGLVPSTSWAANATNVTGSLLYAYVYPGSYKPLSDALNSVTGGWGHYDVIPSTGLNAQTGNILRVTNDCRYSKNDAVQLAWANTRGGWDYLRFNGKKQKTVTREEKTYRKIVGDYDAATFTFAPSERQIKPYQLEAKERYQLNGILTIEELTLLQYCMRSKNVMARIDDTWVPVTISTNSMQVEEETVSKVFVTSFDVELAQVIRC